MFPSARGRKIKFQRETKRGHRFASHRTGTVGILEPRQQRVDALAATSRPSNLPGRPVAERRNARVDPGLEMLPEKVVLGRGKLRRPLPL
jgi:hypothetical protein